MPEGSLPFTPYRSNHRLHCRIRITLFPKSLLRLSPYLDETVWPTSYFIHHPNRSILLCHHAVRPEEHGGYLLALYEALPPRADRQKRRSLRQWHCRKIIKSWESYSRSLGDLQKSLKVQDQAQPRKVYLQDTIRQTARLHRIGSRDWGQSNEGQSHPLYGTPSSIKRHLETHGMSSFLKLAYL